MEESKNLEEEILNLRNKDIMLIDTNSEEREIRILSKSAQTGNYVGYVNTIHNQDIGQSFKVSPFLEENSENFLPKTPAETKSFRYRIGIKDIFDYLARENHLELSLTEQVRAIRIIELLKEDENKVEPEIENTLNSGVNLSKFTSHSNEQMLLHIPAKFGDFLFFIPTGKNKVDKTTSIYNHATFGNRFFKRGSQVTHATFKRKELEYVLSNLKVNRRIPTEIIYGNDKVEAYLIKNNHWSIRPLVENF